MGQHVWERCDTARTLLRRGCPFDRLEDPRGSTVLLKNRKITLQPKEQRRQQQLRQVTQLQPQSVLLHLRPGGWCINHLSARWQHNHTIFHTVCVFFFIKEMSSIFRSQTSASGNQKSCYCDCDEIYSRPRWNWRTLSEFLAMAHEANDFVGQMLFCWYR